MNELPVFDGGLCAGFGEGFALLGKRVKLRQPGLTTGQDRQGTEGTRRDEKERKETIEEKKGNKEIYVLEGFNTEMRKERTTSDH